MPVQSTTRPTDRTGVDRARPEPGSRAWAIAGILLMILGLLLLPITAVNVVSPALIVLGAIVFFRDTGKRWWPSAHTD